MILIPAQRYFQLAIMFLVFFSNAVTSKIPSSTRSDAAIRKNTAQLSKELRNANLTLGSAIYIRIFKKSSRLELWIEGDDKKFHLFKNYKICTYSGKLGPKIKQGDRQSPEGFYFVTPSMLNPWSRFHLSFNLGYPNKYDRYHGRSGSYLMVHGSCVSIGCYAMTNRKMEEIYTLAHHAFENGQGFFRVQIFPFKMSESILERFKQNRWYSFWQNLKPAYDYFETHRRPPNIEVHNGRYVIEDADLRSAQ